MKLNNQSLNGLCIHYMVNNLLLNNYIIYLGYLIGSVIILILSWLSCWLSDKKYVWRQVFLSFNSLILSLISIYIAVSYSLIFGNTINILYVTSPTLTFIFIISK